MMSEQVHAVLENIANTDSVQTEWPKLRNMIKFKIERNIDLFLAEEAKPIPAPAPRPFAPVSSAPGNLKLPPFPARKRVGLNSTEPPVAHMNRQQANELKKVIFEQLDEFEEGAPFTIQRVCELCVNPKGHYKSLGKYLRAVEKSLLVTSSWDSFPPLAAKDTEPPTRTIISIGSAPSSAPATPLFSPIAFLHGDARRSLSRSPPPLSLSPATAVVKPEEGEVRALGLVDELDDPKPGHMSDHPTPLSSVTTVKPIVASLEQRFVKEEVVEDRTEKGSVLDVVEEKVKKEES